MILLPSVHIIDTAALVHILFPQIVLLHVEIMDSFVRARHVADDCYNQWAAYFLRSTKRYFTKRLSSFKSFA